MKKYLNIELIGKVTCLLESYIDFLCPGSHPTLPEAKASSMFPCEWQGPRELGHLLPTVLSRELYGRGAAGTQTGTCMGY